MTLKELKAEAEKQGYFLKKKEEFVKLLPCKCGGVRRSRDYMSSSTIGKSYVRLVCIHCGHKGMWGKTEVDARKLWNEEMK